MSLIITPPFFSSPLLSSIPYLNHGFFTRHGGESIHGGLNCQDKDDAHLKNKKRILDTLGGEQWVGMNQKHTPHVSYVTQPFSDPQPPLDGIITDQTGLVLSVITADCMPLLFADKNKPLIAAVHAGWRGVVHGIIQNTVSLLHSKGGKDLVVCIGPCIHKESFEVGDDFKKEYELSPTQHHFPFSDFSSPSLTHPHKWYFDLPELAKRILLSLNIKTIEILNHNTYKEHDTFFSYRYTTHHPEYAMGCQASCLMIEK